MDDDSKACAKVRGNPSVKIVYTRGGLDKGPHGIPKIDFLELSEDLGISAGHCSDRMQFCWSHGCMFRSSCNM